ncbi:uncharacterized protein LOC122364465 isoform X2 [Amphibalanus amphitrite]|uniref:uncharacterized protein LOC122364465 isoform X2 n=1 Tax=Amphibalanus amphitrite TaxID=1232801 RepID=UPI001C923CE2|nr:uncharacterized protein LOC122364465 isoform X2 [Amphibalanus amphitrite]
MIIQYLFIWIKQDTLESGSEHPDSTDEEDFPFSDILGRGGDLLKGVVVYTIDPFAARRRGGWRPVPSGPSPAVASARLTKGSVGADRKTKVTARSRDGLFSCHGREPGYYPVRQSGCQVYYHCTADGSKFQYRCGGGTAFNIADEGVRPHLQRRLRQIRHSRGSVELTALIRRAAI